MELKPNIDEVLSGFDPARPIGKGGMASIFLYENRLTGETLAVKSLHPNIITDDTAVSRFFHEVQASIRLDHKNIVKVYGYGEWHGKPSMVLEYIDGGDLKSLMERIGIFPTGIAAYIAYQIFKGLDYSHRLGIIHRDIKPSNILIDSSGVIKITDFGISRVSDLTRLTQSGEVLGTPAYMSPEQASGENMDERTDIFSMGVVLYEMLAGVNPFLSENPSLTLLQIIRCDVAPLFEFNPSVPFSMESALDSFLARDPSQRCTSADEAAKTMETVLKELYPDGFAETEIQHFLEDPEGYCKDRKAMEAAVFFEKGKEILEKAEEPPEKALVEFHRSLFLDPENVEAQQYITSITEKFTGLEPRKVSSKTKALEDALAKDPNNVSILLQLVKRYRMEGDFIKAIVYSKRIARLRPKDVYLLGQIETLLPRDHVTAITSNTRRKATPIDRHSTKIDFQRKQPKPQQAKLPKVKSKPIRVSRGDSTLLIFGVILLIIVSISIYAAKKFRQASEALTVEIPEITKFFSQANQNAGVGERRRKNNPGPKFTGRAKELISKAEDRYKMGDKEGTCAYYQRFLDEFPDHPGCDGVRLQLARLYQAIGDEENALRVLDDEILKGRSKPMKAYAQFTKIKLLNDLDRKEDARWECMKLEPHYRDLTSARDQLDFLRIYADLCHFAGDDQTALQLYDRIIENYMNKNKVLEARLLKADILIHNGNLLEAQRELWKVRDQTPAYSLMHKTAQKKLEQLGLEDNSSDNSLSSGMSD